MHPSTDPDRFESRFHTQPVIGRNEQHQTLQDCLAQSGSPHLYIYGPRGTGKTLLVQNILDELPTTITSRYLSCIRYDTQYRILRQLCDTFLDSDVGSGYHASQLQRCLTDNWDPDDVVLVLDEVDFLLQNDGNDLFYYLSRDAPNGIQLVLISANHPDLATEIDDRTYSTLQPRTVHFPPYSESEAAQILADRAQAVPGQPTLADDALTVITSTTTNIRLGQHWLAAAFDAAEGPVTPTIVDEARQEGVDRYHDTLLADFSPHHRQLLAVIKDHAADGTTLTSGTVYQEYQDRCRVAGESPLTTRRISTYLKHLELLGIIESTYHYGGEKGKTRDIRLQQL